MDEYMKIKMDLEEQDVNSIQRQHDPERVIRILCANALTRLMQLLQPHLDAVKDAANRYIQLNLHEEEGRVKLCDIQSAKSIQDLLSLMSIYEKWDSTCFLQQAVDAMPMMSIDREVAKAILSHYEHHLLIHEQTTLMKDTLAKRKKSDSEDEEKAAKGLVPVEITSSTSYTKFTCRDCRRLQVHILSQAYGIPEEKITCLRKEERKSTTVTFLIPGRYIHTIMQHSSQLRTVWIMLELTVIEVTIPRMFTFIPSVQCFLTLLRGGKTFTDDLLGATEVRTFITGVYLYTCKRILR